MYSRCLIIKEGILTNHKSVKRPCGFIRYIVSHFSRECSLNLYNCRGESFHSSAFDIVRQAETGGE